MTYPSTRTTLLARLSADETAWTEFFARYRNAIADLGNFKGLTAAECDELVQLVMIRFHRKIAAGFRYDPCTAKFRTFFGRVIKGCIFDLLRRRGCPMLPIEEVPELCDGGAPDELLDMALLEKWRNMLRGEAMLALAQRVDDRTFQAFSLYAVNGRPAKEAARMTGLSVNSVYVAKSRCIAILREIIRELNREDPELHLHE